MRLLLVPLLPITLRAEAEQHRPAGPLGRH
jgi:hypothetical protein